MIVRRGFTAVELLITLFVASVFLGAGYTLFSFVIRDSGDVRAEVRATRVANDYLGQYSVLDNACEPASPLVDEPVAVEGLNSVRVSVDVSCPNPAVSNLALVEVTVVYNSPEKTIALSGYGRGGAPTVAQGMVGWWPMDGSADDASGNGSDGTVNGATLTEGHDGSVNGAYNFDGVDDYIDLGGAPNVGELVNDLTVSGWVMSRNLSGVQRIIGPARTNSANGVALFLDGSTLRFTTFGVKDYFSTGVDLEQNTWYHVAATMDSDNNVTFFVDGQAVGTDAHTAPGVANNDDHHYIGAHTATGSATLRSYFSGAIDDVRVYDRVLINQEIQQLYGGGAVALSLPQNTDNAWRDLSMQNSWTEYSDTYSSPQYRMTSGGVVVLKGLVKKTSGTASASEVIANLPAGYRPTGRLMFVTNSTGSDHGRVDVDPSGAVDFYYGREGWLSLEGIRFVPAGSQYERTEVSSFDNGWSNYGGNWAPASYVMDGMNRVHTQGLISTGTTSIGTPIFDLPSSHVSSRTLLLPQKSAGSSTFGNIRVVTSGIGAGGGATDSYSSVQAMYYPSTYTGWNSISLQNGWQNYGGSFSLARYTKSQDGLVTLTGLIRNGTTTGGTTMFNLPHGYRPAKRILSIVTTNYDPGRVDVQPDGDVSIQVGQSQWLSLDGLSFYADQ